MREILAEELAKGLDAYWRLSADDALDAARARLVSVLGVSCACSIRKRHASSSHQDARSVLLPRHPVACIDMTVGLSSVQRHAGHKCIMDLKDLPAVGIIAQSTYCDGLRKKIRCRCGSKSLK